MYLVYKHTSPSGKSYIGITDNYDRRSREHRASSSGCKAFYAAIQKYGWDNFLHEVLYDHLDEVSAREKEIALICEYGSMVPYGYNLTPGGDRGPQTAEAIEKRRQKAIGRLHTEETKRKMSETHTGRKRSLAHCAAIRAQAATDTAKANRSAAHSGMVWWNNGVIVKRARECPGPDFTKGRVIPS